MIYIEFDVHISAHAAYFMASMYIAASIRDLFPMWDTIELCLSEHVRLVFMTLVTRLEWVLTECFSFSHMPGSETTLCAFVCHSRQMSASIVIQALTPW